MHYSVITSVKLQICHFKSSLITLFISFANARVNWHTHCRYKMLEFIYYRVNFPSIFAFHCDLITLTLITNIVRMSDDILCYNVESVYGLNVIWLECILWNFSHILRALTIFFPNFYFHPARVWFPLRKIIKIFFKKILPHSREFLIFFWSFK